MLGVDACAGGWVGVAADTEGFMDARGPCSFQDLISWIPDAAVIGVDIPIGVLVARMRSCDTAAAARLGRLGRSVFQMPPRAVLEERDYKQANELATRLVGRRFSRQSHGLGARVSEVEAVAATDSRVIEVHPEVSFAAMNHEPLEHAKKTWAGMNQRLLLLASEGIELPGEIGENYGTVGVFDLIDAAAAAWSARRHLKGLAEVVCEPEYLEDGRAVTIWY